GRAARIADPALARLLEPLDLHSVVVEDRSPAHVGVSLVHRGIDVRAVLGAPRPPPLGAGHHAGSHARGHLHLRDEPAAVVEAAGLAAGVGPAGGRVVGVDTDRGRPERRVWAGTFANTEFRK